MPLWFSFACPLRTRPIEKGRFHPRSFACDDCFEAGHEAGLAVMIAADLGHQFPPSFVEPSRLVTSSSFFKVCERLMVILALCGV
jgi:hypothetical protein